MAALSGRMLLQSNDLLMRRLLKLLAAVCSGAALSLAYPGVSWSIVAWAALMPLMLVVWTNQDAALKRNGFLTGYLFGFSFFAFNLSWLSTVSWLGMVVLAGYLALYPALWAMVSARWMNPWRKPSPSGIWAKSLHSLGFAMMNAALWMFLEWLRGWMLTGFGWNGLGIAMHQQHVLVQSADIFGVAGLSGIMVFVQAVVLQVVARILRYEKPLKRRSHPDLAFAALLVSAIFAYGFWRISSCGARETFPLRVLLVQLNIPQEAARQTMSAQDIHAGYEEEVAEAMEEVKDRISEAQKTPPITGGESGIFYPDWLVLPEVALTGRLMSATDGLHAMWPENQSTIEAFRSAGEFDILMGMGELESIDTGEMLSIAEDPEAWNSLVVFPRDASLQSYRKKHLVMFGEYIPLLESMPWLKTIYEKQAGTTFDGSFTAGLSRDPLPMTLHGRDLSIIPSICFEDTVPRETQVFLRPEAQVIVNVTNDGWFKESCAADQHFANAKFRAIELRRPMIRCANSGVSSLIGITGQSRSLVNDKGSHFTRGHLFGTLKIPEKPPWSPYQTWGDIPVIIAGLVSLIAALWFDRRAKLVAI
jgi:apolipoprotein N-acyltransferase